MFKSDTLQNRAQAKASMVRELFGIMRTPTDATSVRSSTHQDWDRASVRPSDYYSK